MNEHRATLIQDIREYLGILLPVLRPILEQYAYTGIDEESAIKWIITEELELIHCMCANNHIRSNTYERIYSQLNSDLPQSLSILTNQYIRAPRLYDESCIDIHLHERDLYIGYFSPPPPFVQYEPLI